jgi:hypothetical protein
MKKRWILIIVPLLILISAYSSAAEQKITMDIEGMTCTL